MHMKITFHSKKPKWVERKRVGRGATEKQSSISFYQPFNVDHPPRYPQLDYRKPFPRAKTGPRGRGAGATAAPRTPNLARAPWRAGSAPNRSGAEAPSPCRDSRGISLPAPAAPHSVGGQRRGRSAPAAAEPGSGHPPRGSPRGSLLPAAGAGDWAPEGQFRRWLPPGSLFLLFPPALILLFPRSLRGGGSVPGGPRPEGRCGSPAAARPSPACA